MQSIIKQTQDTPDAAIIWMHGLGASCDDFAHVIPSLNLRADLAIRFIFPQAPERPVTINGGYLMPAWYDISGLDESGRQDEQGIMQSAVAIESLIKAQQHAGIAPERIMLAGFSQGGAMALYTGLCYQKRLAGILALSCYLPIPQNFLNHRHEQNQQTPILMQQGMMDDVVTLNYAEHSSQFLMQHRYSVNWQTYAMGHQVLPEQLHDIGQFINETL